VSQSECLECGLERKVYFEAALSSARARSIGSYAWDLGPVTGYTRRPVTAHHIDSRQWHCDQRDRTGVCGLGCADTGSV
jgi:hypothetical protein